MKIFFVRHGHPDYTELKALGYPGFGNDLAPLDALGRSQAEQTARDPRLKQGQLIVASPFTRALADGGGPLAPAGSGTARRSGAARVAAGSHVFSILTWKRLSGPGRNLTR